MAAGTEMVPNGPLCGKKSLGMSRGFEAAHRSLSLACWLVRVLRPIVEALVLAVLHAGQYILFSCCIAAELIGDQHARDILTPFQQLAEELLGGSFVPPALDQDIEHIPMLINRAPKIVVFRIDGEEHLVEMPLVAGLCPSPAQLIGILLAELPTPLAYRFIAQYDAASGHKFFHIAITKRESKVQPYSMADNLDGKAMALIGGGRQCIHAPIIPHLQVPEPAVWLT